MSDNIKNTTLGRRDVKDVVSAMAGAEGIQIFKNIPENGFINEFKLADKVSMNINYVRSILYRFYSKKIVEYQRKKDIRKGWFIYYWRVVPEKIDLLLLEDKRKHLDELKRELEAEEESTWMKCPTCKKKFSYEKALELNFTCPSCEATLQQSRKSTNEILKEIKSIEKEIDKFKTAS